MAEFLIRHSIVHHLRSIIKDAETELVLISPYINFDEDTRRLLADTKRSVSVDVVYGKGELKREEKEFLDGRSIRRTFRKDLHAKCYLNEKKALLTSMNLYRHSMDNNDEMGILVSQEEDRDLYEDIYRQTKSWIENRTEEGSTTAARSEAAKHDKNRSGRVKTHKTQEIPTRGFCIRCRADLPTNPLQPYCSSCYRSWNRFKNATYEENHCHTCGEEHAATLLKPCAAPATRITRTYLNSQSRRGRIGIHTDSSMG